MRLWYGGKIAEVKSTRGQTFFVDLESLPDVREITWRATPCRRTGKFYFGGRKPKNSRWATSHILLHRWLLKYQGPLDVDHKDGNPANNTMRNIRLVTAAGNANNARMYKNNTSGENGVSFVASRTFWRVVWSQHGKRKTKTFPRTGSVKPPELEQFINDLQQEGLDSNIATWKVESKAYYLFQWRKDNRKRNKCFPATLEGYQQALEFRQEVYKKIGNSNGNRLI